MPAFQYLLEAQPAFVLDRTGCELHCMIISCICSCATQMQCFKSLRIAEMSAVGITHYSAKQLDSADCSFVHCCIDRLLVQQHQTQQFMSILYSRGHTQRRSSWRNRGRCMSSITQICYGTTVLGTVDQN